MNDRLTKWIGPALLALLALSGLYLVFMLYVSGQTVVAGVGLFVVALMVYVYTAPGAYSYRYLFPGVAGALIFVVFPMVYTIAIGFTNYSSKNLLEFDRATKYLLDETYQTEGQTFATTIHREGSEYRLKLDNEDVALSFVTGPLALKKAERVVAQATPTGSSEVALGDPLELRDIIPLRNMLKEVIVKLPDGVELTMSGLREFAPVKKLYSKNPDGSLTNVQTGQIVKPNFKTGFYETAQGDQLAPGFKVGIGLDNFRRVLGDESIQQPFLRIFAWNVTFSFMSVLLTAAVGMFLAVLLNWEAIAGRNMYRTFLFLPYAVPGFISILVFKGLFNNNFGEINLILDQLIGVKPPWFSDPTLAKVMILIVNTWLGYPYMMVLCQGLIKSIPADLYEASALAGAGPLTNFFKITMPLILKPLMPLLISSFAFNFNNFVLISLLTNGRPDFLDTKIPAGETDILVSYTYRIAFGDSGQQFGLAAAISTVIFIMVAILSIINLRLTKVNQQEAR
ncbi:MULTISPECIES: maltose ABC transporter permease MalF [Niveibacterium]|uniref:Maltose/maltodextrin transport system permease protein n=2 Tax=Niveibacterium TaxID=1769726 RepID=A0ABX7MCB0_9RHOO|nr:maltose ABC transporter permease MalF [Niveibacterium microcysteis]QSI78798.1 maltose ABC transporter permease MalF [Niveibacterium microcysteis]